MIGLRMSKLLLKRLRKINLVVPSTIQYTNSMKNKITNTSTLKEAGIAFVPFKNEDEETAICEITCDTGDFPDLIVTGDGWFCKAEDLENYKEQFNEYIGDLDSDEE